MKMSMKRFMEDINRSELLLCLLCALPSLVGSILIVALIVFFISLLAPS